VVDGRSGLCVEAQPQATCARGAQRWRAASPSPFRRESGRWHLTDDFYTISVHVGIVLDRTACNSMARKTCILQHLRCARVRLVVSEADVSILRIQLVRSRLFRTVST
jgi:hypothetical protein